jgi:hypothetical protein
MVGCFTCGIGFNGDTNKLLSEMKRQFETNKIERYFYHVGDGKIKIIRKEGFNEVFEKLIKPNLDNGAEYAHIKEYGLVR